MASAPEDSQPLPTRLRRWPRSSTSWHRHPRRGPGRRRAERARAAATPRRRRRRRDRCWRSSPTPPSCVGAVAAGRPPTPRDPPARDALEAARRRAPRGPRARAAAAPRLLELPVADALEVQLALLRALTGARAVALWAEQTERRPPAASRTPASLTDRLGRRTDEHGAAVPIADAARSTGALPSTAWTLSAPELRLAARRRGARARGPARPRDAADREHWRELVVGAVERRLARLRFDLHDGPQQDVHLLAQDLRLFREQLRPMIDGDPNRRPGARTARRPRGPARGARRRPAPALDLGPVAVPVARIAARVAAARRRRVRRADRDPARDRVQRRSGASSPTHSRSRCWR